MTTFLKRGTLASLPLLAALMVSGPAAAAPIVAPNGADVTEGGGAAANLFNTSARSYQVVYSAADMALSAGSLLTGVIFRANGGLPASNLALNFTAWDIYLDEPATAPGTTFAFSTATLVRSGALNLAADSFPVAPPGPNSFPDFYFVFDTPYLYEGGDLLMAITHSGSGTGSFGVDALLSATAAAAPYSSSAIGATTYEAATGTASASVVIARFQVQQVPEPATWLLTLAGLGLAGGLRKRRVALN